MANRDHQLLVAFCDADESVQKELSFDNFGRLLSGEKKLDSHAATTLKSVFCVVGNGLRLKAVVHFVINVDERGLVDPGFNVPLMYLAEQAGVAEDLGDGGIRIASRGNCAVPWHSLNLWEAKTADFTQRLQQRIYRNRLKLQAVVQDGVEYNPGDVGGFGDLPELACAEPQAAQTEVAEEGGVGSQITNRAFTERLEAVFGTTGKLTMQDMIRLHTEQLAEAKAQYRHDVEHQQSSYLAQLREVRDEVQELKVALRQEQGRNRRLQQMLRSEP